MRVAKLRRPVERLVERLKIHHAQPLRRVILARRVQVQARLQVQHAGNDAPAKGDLELRRVLDDVRVAALQVEVDVEKGKVVWNAAADVLATRVDDLVVENEAPTGDEPSFKTSY